jgi:branched-subunit amino acid ABC-type transport system permease component
MVVNGLLAGFIYVMLALGLSLILGIMRIMNFARGEFYMFGAVVVLLAFGSFGLPFFVAVLLGGLISGAAGVVIERVLFRRMVGDELGGMMMSLAVSIMPQSIALIVFGPSERTVARPFSGTLGPFGAVVPWDRTVVAFCAIVVLLTFYPFPKHSRLGLTTANAITRKAGEVICVGLGATQDMYQYPHAMLVAEEKAFRGSLMGGGLAERDIPLYLNYFMSGRMPVDRLKSNTIGFDDLNVALDRLDRGEVVRQILLPNG